VSTRRTTKEQQDHRFIEVIKSRGWTGHVDGMEKQNFLNKSQCKYQIKLQTYLGSIKVGRGNLLKKNLRKDGKIKVALNRDGYPIFTWMKISL
jgi:hypothetical protein